MGWLVDSGGVVGGFMGWVCDGVGGLRVHGWVGVCVMVWVGGGVGGWRVHGVVVVGWMVGQFMGWVGM